LSRFLSLVCLFLALKGYQFQQGEQTKQVLG
jgi:hypothetical protein